MKQETFDCTLITKHDISLKKFKTAKLQEKDQEDARQFQGSTDSLVGNTQTLPANKNNLNLQVGKIIKIIHINIQNMNISLEETK